MSVLLRKDIEKLFTLLDQALADDDVVGELYLVGGAVMCLLFNARGSTRDVDGVFEPSARIREVAKRVAEENNLPGDWLNDGVKGFMSDAGSFDEYRVLGNLRILAARADYLLAMKCLAMRIGEEFQDLEDVRYLLRYLNINCYKDALETVMRYYPIERFPQKTLYVLEELLGDF